MNQVKHFRQKMFSTRNRKKRLELMYLVRGLEWRMKRATTVMVAVESFDLDWEISG